MSLEISLFNKVNSVKTFQENTTNPLMHRCSNNHRYDFPAFWMSIPGDVNIFQWDRKWFYSRRAEFDSWINVMTAYEVRRNKSEIFSFFFRHPEMSLENIVGVETLLILQGNLDDVLLELGDPVSRRIFSIPDLFQKTLLFHLRLGICIFLHLEALSSPLHWVFSAYFLIRPSLWAAQESHAVCLLSKFIPYTRHSRGIFWEVLSCQIDGFATGLSWK